MDARMIGCRLGLALACGTAAAVLGLPGLAAASPGRPVRLYVALTSSNAVSFYDGLEGRRPAGQIVNGVQGPVALATSPYGILYVANSNATITAYAPGGTSPSLTYTTGVGHPAYLATGPDGSLYASDPSAKTVTQFGPGSTAPVRTISFAAIPLGIAVDHDGNLYVVVGTDILRFEPGSTEGRSQGFDLENQPSTLGFDPAGNFVVIQSAEGDDLAKGGSVQSAEAVAVFARRAPHEVLGDYAGFPGLFDYPVDFAFSADGKSLYASDPSNDRVVRIVYPQGNFANVIDGVYSPSGAIAVDPGLSP